MGMTSFLCLVAFLAARTQYLPSDDLQKRNLFVTVLEGRELKVEGLHQTGYSC